MATAATRATVRAHAKWVRTSARKARVVAEHIRGRSVPEARTVLAFTQRAAARDIEKVLASAVANAEAEPTAWYGDDLYVSRGHVDEGPTLKRWRARARGRVARIKKRTCHITVTLDPGRGRRRAAEARRRRPRRRRRPPPPRRRPRRRGEKPEARPAEAQGRRREPAKPRHRQEDRKRGELVGQKVHPGGLRVGVIHDWKSNWYTSARRSSRTPCSRTSRSASTSTASSATPACPTS